MKHNSACPVVEWYASHIQKQANKFIKNYGFGRIVRIWVLELLHNIFTFRF